MKKNKCAIIGISSNLGSELAINLIAKNEIIGTTRKSIDCYPNKKKYLEYNNINCKFIKCDLTKESDVEFLKDELSKEKINSLICISGSYQEFNSKPFMISNQDQANLIQSHSFSYGLLINELFKVLKNISVVYISSTSIFWKGKKNLFYSSAKAHAEHLLLSIASNHLDTSNRLNIVRLSIMEKPFAKDFENYSIDDFNNRVSLMPQKKPISFKQASDLINFLISDTSKAINGNIISLDRGESIKRLSL